eukprot:CAMPEP_0201489042 /NCGR_PEP_ID=MMETSP0151_2-20130828/20987_1 /ASSEMBLY_ACC=CAM_ASM_000257 /TAXON_ID=200890 /ORGANISM="Paramoeba atlantica, Strain 621/1 / CCAP 1560/9" /LENGTH=883 /DNA_ID=CAMNT_0047874507 /DNA_START=107 /DNA_END=2755 /DNA_ORIENTATION=+
MGEEEKRSVWVLALIAFVVLAALVVGLSVGLSTRDDDDDDESDKTNKASQGERMVMIMNDFERSSRTRATRSDTKSFKICGDSETLQTYAPAIAAMLKSTFGDNCIDVEGDYNFLGFQSLSTLFYRPSIEHNHDNGCDALQKYVDRYNDQDGGEFFSTKYAPSVWLVGETELFGEALPIEFLIGFDDRGGLEPDFLMSLGNIPVGWSPRHLKFLDDDSWLHDLESSSEVTKFMVTSRSIFSSNDCTVIRGVNLEFSVGDAFGAAYAGIIEFGSDFTISGWLNSKKSDLKLSSDSISIGFSPIDSIYSTDVSSLEPVCLEDDRRRKERKGIAPRDDDSPFSFSGVTIEILSLDEVPRLGVAFDFGLNYPYLTSTSGSFAGYTTDDYSLYLEGTIESLNMFEVLGEQIIPADFSTSIQTTMTVQSNLVMITGTLDASLELGSSSFEVTLSFHAENSDLVFMVEDLEISNLFEAVGDAVGLTSEQSETLGDIFSFGGTTFDLAIANGYNVFSHWPSSWPDTLSNQMVVPGLTVRSAASLKEIVTELLSPLEDVLPTSDISSKIPENEISLSLSIPALEGLDGILDTSIDLGIEISEEIDGTVIIDSLELYVNPLNVPPVIGGILSLRVLFPGETEMFDLAGFAEFDGSSLWIGASLVGVWEDPYGLKDFDVGNIIATVCIQAPPVPICGVGLGFYARLGDIQIEFLGQVSETIAFCGYVENLSLGSLAEFFYEANTDNDFPEVLDLILSTIGFEDLYVYYAPEDTVIGEVVLEAGMAFDGSVKLFHLIKAEGRIEITDRFVEELGITLKDVKISMSVSTSSLVSALADLIIKDCDNPICETIELLSGAIDASLTIDDLSLFDIIEGDLPSLTMSIKVSELSIDESI